VPSTQQPCSINECQPLHQLLPIVLSHPVLAADWESVNQSISQSFSPCSHQSVQSSEETGSRVQCVLRTFCDHFLFSSSGRRDPRLRGALTVLHEKLTVAQPRSRHSIRTVYPVAGHNCTAPRAPDLSFVLTSRRALSCPSAVAFEVLTRVAWLRLRKNVLGSISGEGGSCSGY
jgi:hypothetical protein